jgi:predicted MPP superfamily phosphohydrolase
MKLLFATDLHYSLKQFDWLVANAGRYDLVVLGGDLLDLSSAVDIEVQIVVIEKYLHRIRAHAPMLVCSGNHDGNRCSATDESVAEWLLRSRRDDLFVDGESALLEETLVEDSKMAVPSAAIAPIDNAI